MAKLGLVITGTLIVWVSGAAWGQDSGPVMHSGGLNPPLAILSRGGNIWEPAEGVHPQYPMQVRFGRARVALDGGWYNGSGLVAVLDGPQKVDFRFDYSCGIGLVPQRGLVFAARWVTPRKKLEVLLQEPGKQGTATCRLSVRQPSS